MRKMTRNEGKRAWRMKEKARDAGKTASQHGTVYKRPKASKAISKASKAISKASKTTILRKQFTLGESRRNKKQDVLKFRRKVRAGSEAARQSVRSK